MSKETYGVIGLGKFGYYVANGLIEQGKKVIIADKNENSTRDLADKTDMIFILDSTDVNALKEAGFSNLDFVILSIGENIESSILTLMALKEIGVKNIITKAITLVHGKILSKLGASKVIYPEKEAAQHLLRSFIAHPEFEHTDISNILRTFKFKVTANYIGLTAKEILNNLLTKKEIQSSIQIIAIKKSSSEDWIISQINENEPLFEGAKIVFLGTRMDMEHIKI